MITPLNALGNGAERRPSSSSTCPPIFIGLGSNLGDRIANIRAALQLMEQAGIRVLKTSSLYETEPAGPPQPDYLNAVCLVETPLSPENLLVALKKIEKEAGRVPRQRWGPREIDLDVLLYGDLIIETPDLSIPHKEILNRPFVLIPLLEIAPGLELPCGKQLAAFAPEGDAGVRRYHGQYL